MRICERYTQRVTLICGATYVVLSKMSKETITSIACPTVSLGLMDKAISALYLKKTAKYTELAALAGIHQANVSKALRTAIDVGLANDVSGERGVYTLTPEGVNYAQKLSINDITGARLILQKQIVRSPLWGHILSVLKARKDSVTAIELALEIERILDRRWSESMRKDIAMGVRTILEGAGIVTIEGDQMHIENEVVDFVSQAKPYELQHVAHELDQSVLSTRSTQGMYRKVDYMPDFLIQIRMDAESLDFFEEFLETSMAALLKRLRLQTSKNVSTKSNEN